MTGLRPEMFAVVDLDGTEWGRPLVRDELSYASSILVTAADDSTNDVEQTILLCAANILMKRAVDL